MHYKNGVPNKTPHVLPHLAGLPIFPVADLEIMTHTKNMGLLANTTLSLITTCE